MSYFKGPKYQQGKIGYDPEPEVDTIELAKSIARKSKITKIEIDGKEALYIYVDYGRQRYGQRTKYKMLEHIKEEFEKQLPGVKVVVGFLDLQFSGISEKQAFAEKIAGTVI